MAEERKVTRVDVSYSALIALLQGKELHLIDATGQREYVFIPPFDGVFLTHDQIQNIKYNAQFDVFAFMDEIRIYEENITTKENKEWTKSKMEQPLP